MISGPPQWRRLFGGLGKAGIPGVLLAYPPSMTDLITVATDWVSLSAPVALPKRAKIRLTRILISP